MIVVDTNVIAYLYLPTEYTSHAEALLSRDPEWLAPVLWRSELRNVLALYMRKGVLDFDQAFAIQQEAEALMADRNYDPDSLAVLKLADDSGCSAYDCEFVALARFTGLPLVTMDKKVLEAFPDSAVALTNFTR